MLWIAAAITLAYAGVEAGVGWWAGSLALVADAGHMINDAGALTLAAAAAWLTRRPVSTRHSYGFGRAEFLAALVNSGAMLALVVWLAVSATSNGCATLQAVVGEARIADRRRAGWRSTSAGGLAARVAGSGISRYRAALRCTSWESVLGSVAALLSGIVIAFTGWTPIDPLLSLGIGALVLLSSLRLLREALHGLMEGTPLDLALEDVGQSLARLPGVISVHDLHIWSVAPEKVMLSAHLVVGDLRQWETVLDACLALLGERFGIHHVTLQPEPMARTVHWLDARSKRAATVVREKATRPFQPPANAG